MTEPEVLVTISLRFPALDRAALGEHIGPIVTEALKAGGISTHVGLQPYDPDDDDD